MKKTKLIYWTATILFVGFMLFSSIPDALMTPEAVTFMTHLGYPSYFISFIGVAKILGCIAIVVPGFPKIKEWAYAGMAFDLLGAIYSLIANDGFHVPMLFMLVPLVLGMVSYLYYQKMITLKNGQ